jgi:prepilin-type N-terminal cleavage/methylation domain-containing protein
MPSTSRFTRGFTLVELMVTVAVTVILIMLAVPSFTDFRQRTAIRGATERTLSFWNNARLEAAKRNSMVKFGVFVDGDEFCLGATTTTDPSDETACDCFETNTSDPAYCNVSRYPARQSQWDGVTFPGGAQMTLGEDTGVVVIEPKRTALTDTVDAGAIGFDDPAGSYEYRVNMVVDALGRARLCGSTSSTDILVDYENRQCAP